jgi:hypothetical protein
MLCRADCRDWKVHPDSRFNEDVIVKKRPVKEQQLDELESDFRPLLLSCLEECRNGRWGLFGQNDNMEAAKYLHWEEENTSKEYDCRLVI